MYLFIGSVYPADASMRATTLYSFILCIVIILIWKNNLWRFSIPSCDPSLKICLEQFLRMKGNCDRIVTGAMCLHVNEETILVSSVKTSFLVKEYHQPMGNNSSGWISWSGRYFQREPKLICIKGMTTVISCFTPSAYGRKTYKIHASYELGLLGLEKHTYQTYR